MARPVQPDLDPSSDAPNDGSAPDQLAAPAGVAVAEQGISAGASGGAAIQLPAPPRKKWRIFYYLAIAWLALIVFAAVFADVLPLRDPNFQVVRDRLAAPGEKGYILGTDDLGRDLLSRLAYGARVSLIISITAVLIGSIFGGALGLTAGFFRGWYERIVMSFVDVLLAFPALVLLLALVAFVGQSLRTISLVIGFLAIPSYSRVARATTLAVSQREYVMAARALGAKSSRILFKELLPNVALPVVAFGLVALGLVIVAEGGLAFLGLSVEFPTATWGSLIAQGKRSIRSAPHLALIPSLVMLLTVLSLNYVGDTLRSRFDVRESAL
ncbi:MAG TPA: ABC transporter permease [Acidimicrobiales bacterium]|nr:ABC transporter permease [Acidimicrobiales bacterium]